MDAGYDRKKKDIMVFFIFKLYIVCILETEMTICFVLYELNKQTK